MAERIDRARGRPLAIHGHPIYSALLPIPILCFVGALITDVTYSGAPDMMWLDFSAWLLLAGLISGGLVVLFLVFELVRVGSGRTGSLAMHGLLFGAAWIVEVLNSFVHARDGWTAVVPTGLILSVVAVILALLSGWFWQAFAHRRAGETL